MMSRERLLSAISVGLFPADSSQFSKSLIRTLCKSSGHKLAPDPIRQVIGLQTLGDRFGTIGAEDPAAARLGIEQVDEVRLGPGADV